MDDMRNALAKARDAWLDSAEGQRCETGSASGRYLRNRLECAFVAGWNAAERDDGGARAEFIHINLAKPEDYKHLETELTALRAECDALRAALRSHVIRESFGKREFRCVNCGGAWDGAAEQHSATCLAAPRKEGERA